MWRYFDTRYSEERLLTTLFAVFLVCLVLTPIVRDLAKRRSLLDQPNHRSLHSAPLPRLGGVSIVFATMLGMALLERDMSWRTLVVVVAAVIMALAGFVDDIKSITVVQKYAPQLAAAALAAWAVGPNLEVDLPLVDFRVEGWLAVVLGTFWITAFINAFNFMDGVDGIASGVGLLSAVGMTLLSSGHAAYALLPLAAALAGFLPWNIDPASIFMGDGGSQFVGLLLAAGALHWPASNVDLIVVVIAFAPFLFDTGFTLLWRIWKRLNVFRAHRSHLYQRLTMVGLGHREVANLYIGATALCIMVAAVYRDASGAGEALLILLLIALAVTYVSLVSRLEDVKSAKKSRITRRGSSVRERSSIRSS